VTLWPEGYVPKATLPLKDVNWHQIIGTNDLRSVLQSAPLWVPLIEKDMFDILSIPHIIEELRSSSRSTKMMLAHRLAVAATTGMSFLSPIGMVFHLIHGRSGKTAVAE
jgi:hypothetical protein